MVIGSPQWGAVRFSLSALPIEAEEQAVQLRVRYAQPVGLAVKEVAHLLVDLRPG